nr:RNA-binding protein EWS isoform X1 [Tanacetum cinerariifolium]
MRAGSASPDRRRNGSREYSPDYENSVSPPRDRGFGRGRDSGRYRDYSPPHHGRGRFGGRFGGGRFGGGRFYGGRFGGGRFIGGRFGGGRFGGRFDGGYMGAGFRGDVVPRNNPNVRPREGDWMCTDPA